MDLDYYNRLKERIDHILSDGNFSFQELIKKCKGAYPTEIVSVLNAQCYRTEIKEITMYGNILEKDREKYVTQRIDNNPVLCSWYFSLETCHRIFKLYEWKEKNLLFLGMPRLFEYFGLKAADTELTLVDLDSYVTDSLRRHFGDRGNIICSDINNLQYKFEKKFDYIFLDPPWYVEYYDKWIEVAYNLVDKSNGMIIFPLFQELTRPSAEIQREEILTNLKKCSQNLIITDFVEYDIPTFEKCELENSDILLDSPWKRADLIMLKHMGRYQPMSVLKKPQTDSGWTEIDIVKMRLFIKNNCNRNIDRDTFTIRRLSENKNYLENPSRRNQERQLANILTSRGHGYIVDSTEKFIEFLYRLKTEEKKGRRIKDILDSKALNSESKKILMEIFRGILC